MNKIFNDESLPGKITVWADLVLINGTFYTADSSHTFAEAVAVKNQRIIHVGSNEDIASYIGPPTKTMDLNGKMVLPGFIETHLHTPGKVLAELFKINLYETKSVKDILSAIRIYIKNHPNEAVYYGEGYHGEVFESNELLKGPRKERLDEICPHIPVVIETYDGHTLWLNSKAFEYFGITENTEIKSGIIEKDEVGRLWGTLKEAAAELVPKPSYTEEQIMISIKKFQHFLHSLGYTGILSIADSENPPYSAFKRLDEQGLLKMHVNASMVMLPHEDLTVQLKKAKRLRHTYSSENLKIKTVKFFADGVVEGVTAFLLMPYSEKAQKGDHFFGTFFWDIDKLKEAFMAVNREGFQIHVHAIGDGATRNVLDALEYSAENLPKENHRNTITHLQIVDKEDIKRFAELKVIANIQPYWHFIEPEKWEAIDYALLGERACFEYPVHSFIKHGVVITSSSDHPVTQYPNPFLAIQMGITRNLSHSDAKTYKVHPIADKDDPRWLLNKEERASLKDMLRSFTANSAYALFLETETGSIEAGKFADMIVIDKNIFEIPVMELENTRVFMTIFKGEVVYQRP